VCASSCLDPTGAAWPELGSNFGSNLSEPELI
jgi:hypothetical protein